MAVLKNGQRPEPIKRNPENRMLWLELMEAGHSRCHLFGDAESARQDRERVRTRGQHVARSAREAPGAQR